MKKETTYKMGMLSGLLLVLLAIFVEYMADYSSWIILTFVNMGIIIMVISILKYNRLGAGVIQDERTRKLSAKAVAHSWFLTFILVNIIFWLNQLDILILTGKQTIGIILYLMIFSAAILQYVYKRNGVVNED